MATRKCHVTMCSMCEDAVSIGDKYETKPYGRSTTRSVSCSPAGSTASSLDLLNYLEVREYDRVIKSIFTFGFMFTETTLTASMSAHGIYFTALPVLILVILDALFCFQLTP
ncbi:hypothetical protein BDV28DRAFT_47612 [Aspergillus coremiiformis]|uniref:Uncharacterized protein n=1 Tax=Aspergillus coremiiformis TaxID=138285 RepID=A0A5N6YZF7_9EURO|nr:hypothetical protein BDV28DRAFT_47612 [Aspergillus coremiiformis]